MSTSAGTDEPKSQVVGTLAEFRATVGTLGPEERRVIIQQALVLIEQVYVHLPLKRAMHAVDPIQRLKLLARRAAESTEGLSEGQFQDEMISIFTGLRDLHTRYILGGACRGKTATLPFRVQEFFDAGKPRYVVTEVSRALIADDCFRDGTFVVHWNGVSMERAVELNADRQAASNRNARHARGLNTMTQRPLDTSAMPDEDWVLVGYEDAAGNPRETRIDWQVLAPGLAPEAVDPHAADEDRALDLGLDLDTESVRRCRKAVFCPNAIRMEQTADRDSIEDGVSPIFPDALQFRVRPTAHGEFGHLRIRTFNAQPPTVFLAEVERIIVELLPQAGLIVDVRGNPGGVIMSAELLLQLFTPRRIEPERLHFINTPLMRRLTDREPKLEAWKGSIDDSVLTATPFSDGFPVTSVDDCNALGQRYYGPVVLITDALCYSAADIFAAGWQDHGIGPILGTSRNTGAGGANAWGHGDLLKRFPEEGSPIRPLPEETSFAVAIRRTTRVGDRAGDVVEDVGVIPDPPVYVLTLDDLLHDNRGLLERAGELLAVQPVRALTAEATRNGDGSASVEIKTKGISRLDAYVEGRPQRTLDLMDGPATFTVPVPIPIQKGSMSLLDLKGFDGGDVVVARRLRV